MPDEAVVAIARIPLARSPARMLLVPAVLLLAGAAALAGGWLVSGWSGIGLMAAGGLVAVLAIYVAGVVLSVRLDVEVSTLRLRWLGSERSYALVRGPVTRVPLVGEGAARLRPRLGTMAWGVGAARLRGSEPIHLVRLARTASMILIPTDAGRVGVAPASEEQLIAALTAAARVQQRLEQVTARARAVPVERLVEEPPRAAAPPSVRLESEPGRVLTGIERVLLEERLAAERAAALAAAEAERRRAAQDEEEAAARRAAAAAATAAQAPGQASAAAAGTSAPRVRPGWLRIPRPTISVPAVGVLRRERVMPYLVVAAPLAIATGLWAFASLSGRLDLPETESRLTAMALALSGPAAALGGLAVRAWFPRLFGLVTVTSLCALILVGRALLG